jgi:hypothetical protein
MKTVAGPPAPGRPGWSDRDTGDVIRTLSRISGQANRLAATRQLIQAWAEESEEVDGQEALVPALCACLAAAESAGRSLVDALAVRVARRGAEALDGHA